MSQATNPKGNPSADLTQQYRTIIAKAYGFVAGQQITNSFNALTFEELAAQQIDRISGKGTPGRPNVNQQITRIMSDLTSVAAQIKQTDPSAFLIPDETQDVNTPV